MPGGWRSSTEMELGHGREGQEQSQGCSLPCTQTASPSAAGENKSCISAANTHPQPLAPRRENHSGKTSSVDDNLSCRGSFVQTSQFRQIQQSPLSPPHPAPFVPYVFTIAPEDEAVVLN